VGVGKARDLKGQDFVKLGGMVMARSRSRGRCDHPCRSARRSAEADRIADLALGVQLRAYAFDRYKTKRKEAEERPAQVKVTIAVAGVAGREGVRAAPRRCGRVVIARDLVNEPARALPKSSRRTGNLEEAGRAC
jgi:leucyl aminopeptidase